MYNTINKMNNQRYRFNSHLYNQKKVDKKSLNLEKNVITEHQLISPYMLNVTENDNDNESKSEISIKEAIEEFKQTSNFQKERNIDNDDNNNDKENVKLSFSDNDAFIDTKGNTGVINSPKDEKNLEELEKARELERATMADDEDDDERLVIGDSVKLDILDVNDLDKPASKVELKPPVLDFEVLT